MSGVLGTFGNSPASITLAKILANDEKQLGKVGKLLSSFSLILHEISKTDTKVRMGLANLVFTQYKTTAETYPDTFKTYLLNVLSMRYKIWLEANKAQIPYKTRKNG
jgi:hypothetical protein